MFLQNERTEILPNVLLGGKLNGAICSLGKSVGQRLNIKFDYRGCRLNYDEVNECSGNGHDKMGIVRTSLSVSA